MNGDTVIVIPLHSTPQLPLAQRDTLPLPSPVSLPDRLSTFEIGTLVARPLRLPLFAVQSNRTPCCACGWRGVALAHMGATWAIVAMLAAYALGAL